MKKLLNNISFLEYFELKDKKEYNFALQFGIFEPLDLFKFGDFVDKSFGFVKDFQEIMNYEGLTWERFFIEIEKETKIDKKELVKYSLIDLHRCRLFIKKEIEKINEIELNALGHKSTSEEESADLESFAKYRSFLQFDALAGGDITKIDLVRLQPYSVCLAKLMLDADKKEYEERLMRIRNRKNTEI